MSIVTAFTCKTCNTLKEKDCFCAKKDGTAYYDDCLECWRGEAKLFWETKKFRICRCCDEKLPLRLYTRDKYDVPFISCTPCHEKTVAEEYRKLRSAAACASAVSGIKTNDVKCAVRSTDQNSKPNA